MKLKWCKRTSSKSPNGEIQAYRAGGPRVQMASSARASVRVIRRHSSWGYLSGAVGCTSRLVGRRDPLGSFRSLALGGARAGAWPCAALLFVRTRGDLIGARRYQSLGRGRTEDAFDARFGLHSDRPAPGQRRFCFRYSSDPS